MRETVHYSDGSKIENPVIQIWDDLHAERSGYFRAFWCASADATVGSPVIGVCSPGGSHRRIWQVVNEVRRLGYTAPIYRNGRLVYADLGGCTVTV